MFKGWFRLLAFTVFVVLLFPLQAYPSIGLRCVDILVPAEIRPYMEALRGMERLFPSIRPHIIDRESPDKLKELIKRSPCEAVVALGINGVTIAADVKDKLKVYSFILYPEKYKYILGTFDCGISLNVSPLKIITSLSEYFSNRKVGIVYSDSSIDYYVEDILAKSKDAGLLMKQIRLSSFDEFNKRFDNFLTNVDVVLIIPDPVFSSEKIIRWVIKKCAFLKRGVVGFNRFFIRSGAVAAFVVDYEETGRLTAELLKDLLLKGECSSRGPSVHFIMNKRVYRYLFGHEP